MHDKVLDMMTPISEYVQASLFRSSLVQVICSGLMDIIAFITLGKWILTGRTSRPLLSIGVFYLARTVLQKLFFMPYPNELYYWMDPGFPSVVVPYGKASDFFFSGHSGFLVICLNEWKKWGNKKIVAGIYAALMFTVFTLFVFRIHYAIDVFTGIFYADWSFKFIDKHIDTIDNSLVSIGRKLVIFRSLNFSKFFFIMLTGLGIVGGQTALPNYDPTCLEDSILDSFTSITEYIYSQEMLRSGMQMLFSGLMDLVVIGTLWHWVKNSKSSCLIATIAIFYGTRAVVRQLFDSAPPESIYWESPGLPSVVVSYGIPNTFFFSDYAGLLVICMNEWKSLGYDKVKNGIYLILAYVIFVLLAFRINYSADIFVGALFADWIYDICAKNKEGIDRTLTNFGHSMKIIWKLSLNKGTL